MYERLERTGERRPPLGVGDVQVRSRRDKLTHDVWVTELSSEVQGSTTILITAVQPTSCETFRTPHVTRATLIPEVREYIYISGQILRAGAVIEKKYFGHAPKHRGGSDMRRGVPPLPITGSEKAS